MPKYNRFSKLQEPDDDSKILSDETIDKFREAVLKIETIVISNESDVAFDVATLAKRHGSDVSFECDYADAMEALENVLTDSNANMIIMGIDAIAKNYGWNEGIVPAEIAVEFEALASRDKSLDTYLAEIKKLYEEAEPKYQEYIKNSIADDIRNLSMTKHSEYLEQIFDDTGRHKFLIKQGGVYRVQFTTRVGCEVSGYRPAVVISSDKVCSTKAGILVVPIMSGASKAYNLEITNNDVDRPFITKVCSLHCSKMISVDRSRFAEFYGNVKPEFYDKILIYLGNQIGAKIEKK